MTVAAPKKPRAKRAKKPKHKTVVRTYRFRLAPTCGQADDLFLKVLGCGILRSALIEVTELNRASNRLLKENGSADKLAYMNRAALYEFVKDFAADDPILQGIHSQVLQNVAVRVMDGIDLWLEGLKEGRRHVKPPRFRDLKKIRSITYPQYGTAANIHNHKLYLSGIGAIKVLDYRKILGQKKTVTVKFVDGHWWATITAEQQESRVFPEAENDTRPKAGGDPGLSSTLTDSFGNKYTSPTPHKAALKQLRKTQKALSRKFESRKAAYQKLRGLLVALGISPLPCKKIPYGNRLRKNIVATAKTHTRCKNIRAHNHKKNASIVNCRYSEFAYEDHGVMFMMRNRKLARAAADRALHQQKLALKSKLGSRLIPAPTKRPDGGGNSQTCLCGHSVSKTLKDRIHECPACGLVADRDHVSSGNIELTVFGTTNPTLAALQRQAPSQGGAGVIVAVGGQPAAERGESEFVSGEGRDDRSEMDFVHTLELSEKRLSSVQKGRRDDEPSSGNTGGGKPTPEAETTPHRRSKGRRRSGVEAKNPCAKASTRASDSKRAVRGHGSNEASPL